MTEDRGEIKIRYTLKQAKGDALSSESVRIFPVSGWAIALVLVPTFIALAFLSAFFFAILFPLFLFVGIFFGLWIWWLHRKPLKSRRAENLEEKYVVIEETRIVETKMAKEMNQ
jgi:signal transduction histidine kinase